MKTKLNSKNIFKWEIGILILALLIYVLYIALNKTMMTFNCDNFFQFAHAEYLFNYGFPMEEPLRMHENFSFMMPQWLFASIITFLKNTFGNKAVALLYGLPLLLINGFLFFNLIKQFENKGNKAAGVMYFVGALLYFLEMIMYSYLRPYLFTMFVSYLSFILIEKYVRTNDWKYLIVIPVLSILEINMHNSLWASIFLVQLCYYGSYVISKLRKEKVPFDIKPFIIMTIACFLAGLINPYGIEYILYIFPSMQAVEPFKPFIKELQSMLENSPWLLSFFAFDSIALIYAWKKKIKIPYHFLFAMAGYGLMAFSSVRSAIFFLTIGQMPLLIVLSNTKLHFISKKTMQISLAILSIAVIGIATLSPFKFHENRQFYQAVDTLYMMNDGSPTKEPIFTSFDVGSYALYKGYRVYLDTCAEIYGEEVNHQKDIAEEIVRTFYKGSNLVRVKNFFNQYKFAYCIVDTNNMAKMIEATEQYELVYSCSDIDPKHQKDEDTYPSVYTGGWLYKRVEE